MSWETLGATQVVARPVENSRVVRDVDPRSSRDFWSLLLLVAVLVGALALYAWPHYELRETARASQTMQRERERLLEENRKLRLEKAALEDLRRVETIATRDLGLTPPQAQQVVVVELPPAPAPGARLATTQAVGAAREN
jgi:cell division protein FtsL